MKDTLKRLIKNNSIYKKLVLSFSVIIFVSVLLLSCLLYYNYSRSFIDIWSSLNDKVLSQISYSSVYMDDLVHNFCESILLDNTVKAFLYSDEQDIIITSNAIRTLQALTIPNAYIHSVYVYNAELDLFLSTKDGGFYYSPEFYDQEIVSFLQKSSKYITSSALPIARKVDSDNIYTYIMYDNIREPTNTVILNINTDWLRDTIQSLHSKAALHDSTILIINDDGHIMNNSLSIAFNQDYSDYNYIKRILSSTESFGTFTDHIDGKKYMISFVASESLNWKFVNVVPYKTIFQTTYKIRNITILFCFFVLILGFIFTRYASKRLYHPIKELITGIEAHSPFQYSQCDHADEISFLSASFDIIYGKTNEMEKNKYLKSLLGINSYLMTGELLSLPETTTINIGLNEPMSLFILKVDHYSQLSGTNDVNNIAFCKYALSTLIENITSHYFTHDIIDSEYDHLVVLINIEENVSKEQLLPSLTEMIKKIQKDAKNDLGIGLSAAYGYLIKDSKQLQPLYNDVLEVSMYRMTLGHGCIIDTDYLYTIHDDQFEYPVSEEEKLLTSLKLGNLEDTKKAYFNIIRILSNYSYDCIMSSIIYLTFTIYNTLTSIKTLNAVNFLNEYKKFFENLWRHETLNDINKEFIHFMELITSNMSKATESKSDFVINNILSIIDEKYVDKNLCLNYIADLLDMSPVYIGRLFKEATGKSVSKYIMDKRMEKVKQLLDTTHLSLNDILDQCGIEKNNYFYTVFKKYFGVSLSHYKLTLSKERINNL